VNSTVKQKENENMNENENEKKKKKKTKVKKEKIETNDEELVEAKVDASFTLGELKTGKKKVKKEQDEKKIDPNQPEEKLRLQIYENKNVERELAQVRKQLSERGVFVQPDRELGAGDILCPECPIRFTNVDKMAYHCASSHLKLADLTPRGQHKTLTRVIRRKLRILARKSRKELQGKMDAHMKKFEKDLLAKSSWVGKTDRAKSQKLREKLQRKARSVKRLYKKEGRPEGYLDHRSPFHEDYKIKVKQTANGEGGVDEVESDVGEDDKMDTNNNNNNKNKNKADDSGEGEDGSEDDDDNDDDEDSDEE